MSKGRQGGAGGEGALGCDQRVLSLQESKGYDFESETDTESIAKLVKYMYDNRDSDDISFTTLVERVIQQLVMLGAGEHTQKTTPPVLPRVRWPTWPCQAAHRSRCGACYGVVLSFLPPTVHPWCMLGFL